MEEIIKKLNGCLGWEFRAATMYSHYAAYVTGIHRLQLKAHFEAEATESHGHGDSPGVHRKDQQSDGCS